MVLQVFLNTLVALSARSSDHGIITTEAVQPATENAANGEEGKGRYCSEEMRGADAQAGHFSASAGSSHLNMR